MSWLYLPGSGEASWERNMDSDGKPSVMSNENDMPSRLSKLELLMVILTMLPYGVRCEVLQSIITNAVASFEHYGKFGISLWLQRVSRANHSAWQENGMELMTNETAGLTPFVLFEKSVPDMSSLKTSLGYSAQWIKPQRNLFGISELFSETWPKAGMLSGGGCYRRQRWERRIRGIGSGLLLTPTAQEWGSNTNMRKKGLTVMERIRLWPTPTSAEGKGVGHSPNKQGSPNLRTMVKMFPTPTTPRPHDSENTAGKYFPGQRKGDLVEFVNSFPTPNARDWRSGNGRQENGHTPQLPEKVGGQLNPNWVEWLMGWPIGWTDLKPLEMDKFLRWRQQLFGY